MAVLGRIFDFIKSLFTRPGLHTFLKKYQVVVTQKLEELATLHDGQGLNDWWDTAFSEIKALVQADTHNIKDNWIAIIINLGWEIVRAEQEKHNP